MTEFKVIDHSPRAKKHVATLTERIREAIDDRPDEEKVTFAEVIGALEIVKQEFLKGLLD